jgi:hypothetical protein
LHGQAALEGARAISSADPGAEHEGVAAVEGTAGLKWTEAVEFAM